MKVAIIGYGHVGSAMNNLFKDAVIYDKYKKIGSKSEVNKCNCAFICVPTPMNEDGSCDTSAVDEVFSWLKTDIAIIRSTVPVGYTEKVSKKKKMDVVFQPEYYGETVDHPFVDLSRRTWITLGGDNKAINKAIRVYQTVYNATVDIYTADSRTTELAKYMENSYLALKVTFCNEFYDIAHAYDIDYYKLRELWVADPRIGNSHTFVYEDNRGYGGSCLPKDIAAITHDAKELGVDVSLLEAVKNKNDKYKDSI